MSQIKKPGLMIGLFNFMAAVSAHKCGRILLNLTGPLIMLSVEKLDTGPAPCNIGQVAGISNRTQ